MWRAILKSAVPTPTPTDTFDMTIEYQNEDTGEIVTITHNIHTSNYATLEDISKDVVTKKIADLEARDLLISELQDIIGEDLAQ